MMRAVDNGPNQHLWNNRGIWWCHFNLHLPGSTSQRMRFSLCTRDIDKARERRDRILRDIAARLEMAA